MQFKQMPLTATNNNQSVNNKTLKLSTKVNSVPLKMTYDCVRVVLNEKN